ncbi:MAG: hypothetical protein K2X82_01650 [Gemmataceae bacterium]|nr:hypothetical protein [Gemmataceae bacterium]
MQRRAGWWVVAVVVLGVGLGLNLLRPAAGTAQPAGGGAGGPKYTIVDTEGTNLLVVDNSTNTMYFYTVDPDKTIGDDLHLRGSVDLNEVGKPTIKPKATKKAEGGK